MVELLVLDIQRNVQPINMTAADGMEFVAVSVQLRDIAPADFSKVYETENFQLQNLQSILYPPDLQADNGRILRSGELPPGGSVEGDILFHVPQGETPLFLIWQMTGSTQIFTVALQ